MIEIRPLTPSEVQDRQKQEADPILIQAVNNLLIETLNSSGKCAEFSWSSLKRAVDKLDKDRIPTGPELGRVWLAFRDAGWAVEVDSPGYNESYETRYKFQKTEMKRVPV